jgi:hypothetical protein
MRCNHASRWRVHGVNLCAAAIVVLLFHPARAAAADPSFPLLCKAGVVVTSEPHSVASEAPQYITFRVTIDFRVNPTGAGGAGQHLESGACAWVDRPTNEDEGKRVVVTVVEPHLLDAQMLTQCSITTSCVFQIYATHPEGSALQSGALPIRIQLR